MKAVDTIFTDNLGTAKTEEEFAKLMAKNPDYDPYYIASAILPERKKILSDFGVHFFYPTSFIWHPFSP